MTEICENTLRLPVATIHREVEVVPAKPATEMLPYVVTTEMYSPLYEAHYSDCTRAGRPCVAVVRTGRDCRIDLDMTSASLQLTPSGRLRVEDVFAACARDEVYVDEVYGWATRVSFKKSEGVVRALTEALSEPGAYVPAL